MKPPITTGDLYVERNQTVAGSLVVSDDLTVNGAIIGNLDVSGTILATQFLEGQVINVRMLNYSELSQTQITIPKVDVSANLFTYAYTPKYNNSYLIIEYQTIYDVDGGGSDSIEAKLNVNGAEISHTKQIWILSEGGGTRSGTMFPIVGRYTNNNTTAKAIQVRVINTTDADNIIVRADNSTWLKITEIGR